ncbi:MAG: hypothetical protein ACHQFX_08790 [Chitinophagales bacterium]
MTWQNENCNNGKPVCKKEYECKYLPMVLGLMNNFTSPLPSPPGGEGQGEDEV